MRGRSFDWGYLTSLEKSTKPAVRKASIYLSYLARGTSHQPFTVFDGLAITADCLCRVRPGENNDRKF